MKSALQIARAAYQPRLPKIFQNSVDIKFGRATTSVADNEEIKKINKEYRNIDNVTDVISFALEDVEFKTPFRILGDIYISYEKVKEQALKYEHSEKRELYFLSTHGLLHLLGYDHMNEKEEKIMFDLQKELLDKYDIKR